MKTLRKLAIVAGLLMGLLTGLLALCACSSYGSGQGGDKGGQVDCSTVRCKACPEGQKPALTPPDCCKCVPA